jgi:hypothetical protein
MAVILVEQRIQVLHILYQITNHLLRLILATSLSGSIHTAYPAADVKGEKFYSFLKICSA